MSHQGTTSIVGTYVASASDLVADAGTDVGEDPVDQLEPQPAPPVEGSGGGSSGVPPEAGDGGATVPEEGDVADSPRGSLQDVPAGVHRDAILRMVDQGIIQGRAYGTFRPASSVTRGQVAALLSRAFHLEGPACNEDCLALSDIDASTHAEAIRAVVAAGIASGYHDGTFGPERAVTREQIAAMLAATLELSGDGLEHPFDDIRGTTHEASIAALYHAGITQGSGPTAFSPREPMLRDQYASLLDRSLAGS